MKKLIPLFALLVLLFSCNDTKKKTTVQQKAVPLSERPIPPNPNGLNSNIVVGGAHYICPNKCEGGVSSDKGTCSVCKLELAHNQGYHSTAPANNTLAPLTNAPAATTPASGPNARGQYHYTCTNGCAIGADGAGKCATCGNDLAHNSAYHS